MTEIVADMGSLNETIRKTVWPEEAECANSRNGKRTKTVVTDAVGPVQIEVPRDRDGMLEPVMAKRQRLLTDVDTVVLSRMRRA